MLAANVRSFLSSASYSAPENLPFLIDQKLARPLASYEAVSAPSAPTDLLDTDPVLGKEAFAAWWEADKTGDYPGQRVSEVLSHDYERATCSRCGAVERRHTIKDRMLVGVNKGHVATHYWQRCENGHGCMSNYRRPW